MREAIAILFAFVLYVTTNAQVDSKLSSSGPAPILTEVAIGIPNLKEDQFQSLKTALSGIKGVRWYGYCEDQKYVFLMVNRKMQPDNKYITDVIVAVNSGFQLYFKTASFNALLNACGDRQKAITR